MRANSIFRKLPTEELPEAQRLVASAALGGGEAIRRQLGIGDGEVAQLGIGKRPARIRGRALGRAVDLAGLVDESAGRHPRHTSWWWSAGAGSA